jgi:polyisoprenoid-binding protein YceI
MTTQTAATGLATGTWQLDPARTSAEFHVPNLWGLATVKGRFDRLRGTLDLSGRPAVELVIDAAGLDTGNARRDKHLRSADFFGAAEHPEVRFEADAAELAGGRLRIRGLLYAAGRHVPVAVDAALTPDGDAFAIEAEAHVDQRELGMTWSPLGVVRAPTRLVLSGRLVRAGEVR